MRDEFLNIREGYSWDIQFNLKGLEEILKVVCKLRQEDQELVSVEFYGNRDVI